MTGTHLQSVPDDDGSLPSFADPSHSPTWDEGGGVEGPNKGVQQMQRYASALWRFKWLVLLLVILGAAGGVFATGFITPEYEVQSGILLSADSKQNDGTAADGFRQAGLLDLLVSYQVVDPVVTQLSLFLEPAARADSTIFREFGIEGGVVPGDYALRVTGQQYELVLNGARVVETGTLGDMIGQPVGFLWQPPAAALAGRNTIEFTVKTPRETSLALIKRMKSPSLRQGSNILNVRLTGSDAQRTEATLNSWVENFVAVATQYKKAGVQQRAYILEGQLEYARVQLAESEGALQGFKVRTASLPSESRIPQVAGPDVTTNPVFSAFFNQQVTLDQLQRDRDAINRAAASGPNGGVSIEGLLSVPSVNSDPAATKLQGNLSEALQQESALRVLRQSDTDLNPRVAIPAEALEQLKTAVIPAAVNSFVQQLDQRIIDLQGRLVSQETDLRAAPARSMELGRLQRAVDVADALYRNLLMQSQAAKLAEATTPPDISVLDSAVAPLRPTNKTGPGIIAAAIAAALGLGIALAILLDALDKRFRYPQQATDDLGLFILGVIPNIDRKRRRRSADEAAQMVEAFRTIRMNMRYAVDPTRPFAVTISSPGPNDGKSLVSSNLALSFADGGSRVVLVDGDIRRGELQETFKVPGKPGLVDYLDGTALLPEVLRTTSHPNLSLLPCGKRQRRAPELLTGPRLTQLVGLLKRDYDVVILDSPPLGAGSDAYTLGIAAENMVIVLRAGVSDRKMASAKLRTVESLPIRVLGSVLNGIKMTGVYQYYSYYLDYESKDEDQVKALPSKSPRAAVVKAAGD